MKIIILCGGYGTRMKEETEFKPKPLVNVGGKPILWHIMKMYEHHGHNEFVLALGYKGYMIKNYFVRSHDFLNDFTLNSRTRDIQYHNNENDDFRITFAETGLKSDTGKRILKAKRYITEDDFMVTYGDGVSDVDLSRVVEFHKRQGTVGTICGVHPHSKYGLIRVGDNAKVVGFDQKPKMHDYVSGGFMVFKRSAFDYFDNGEMENGLKKMAAEGQLSVYQHEGYWKAMDTYREVKELNELWHSSKPWATWEHEKTV